MSAEHFAARLRELREAKGWSQEELATKSGISRDGVSHLEQGRRSPGWDTVLALAVALGVDCTAFATQPQAGTGQQKRGRGRPRKKDPT